MKLSKPSGTTLNRPGSAARLIGLLALLTLTLVLVACSSSEASNPPEGPVEPAAASEAALREVGERIYPQAAQFVFYGVCGSNGDLSTCPLTERLAQHLKASGLTLCRCQNPSETRSITVEPKDSGGITRVSLFGGKVSFDLHVVNVDGRLLVDDQTCTGKGVETSIYTSAAPCDQSSGPGGPAADRPTGIAAVDRVLQAVREDNVSKLTAEASFQPLACTTAQGLGGPPACLPGEAAGTVVNVLFTSSCDGHYIWPSELPALAGQFIEGEGRLAGVYRHNGLIFPSSQYVLVFSYDSPGGSVARIAFVSDNGIVGLTFTCGTSAKEYVQFHSLTRCDSAAGRLRPAATVLCAQ